VLAIIIINALIVIFVLRQSTHMAGSSIARFAEFCEVRSPKMHIYSGVGLCTQIMIATLVLESLRFTAFDQVFTTKPSHAAR
jgi:hypothetical protein